MHKITSMKGIRKVVMWKDCNKVTNKFDCWIRKNVILPDLSLWKLFVKKTAAEKPKVYSSRENALGPMFESPLGITILIV